MRFDKHPCQILAKNLCSVIFLVTYKRLKLIIPESFIGSKIIARGILMNATELDKVKSSLLAQKSAILNKTNEFKSEQKDLSLAISDEAEAASVDVSNNLSIFLLERDRSALFLIERALGKIADCTYGLCEECGSEISVKRLQARPFASLCIECMEEQENNQLFN